MQRKYLAFLFFFLTVSVSGFSSLQAQKLNVRIEPETSGRLFEDCSMELIIEMQDIPILRSQTSSVAIECTGTAEYTNLPTSVELVNGKAVVPFKVTKMPDSVDGKEGTITVFSEYYPEMKRELTFTFYNSPTYELTYVPHTEILAGKLELEIKGGSLSMLRRWGDNGEPVDARMPFSQWEIENASVGDVLHLWEPNSCWSSSITLASSGGSNPGSSITRPVTIPVLKEAKTDPGAGLYRITSGNNFLFRIIPYAAYKDYILSVTTDRELPDEEGVKIVKNQDGTYSVTILKIQTTTNIGIKFEETPVDNELVAVQKVWGDNGMLHISSVSGGQAKVYSITGQLIKSISFSSGEAINAVLPKGLYIILMDDHKVHKVIIR